MTKVPAAAFICLPAVLCAAEIHVSPAGSDSASGAAGQPLRTIQAAAGRLRPGDAAVIHAGVYRESVAITNSGCAGAPVTLRAAPGEKAVIDGTDVLDLKWDRWRGDIYKAAAGPQPFRQLFFDGAMMFEARWPNLASLADLWSSNRWSVAGPGSEHGQVVDPRLAATGLDMTGATAVLNVCHQFYTWTRPVKAHRAGSDTFTYARDLYGVGPEEEPRKRANQKADKPGKKAAKDENNETLKFSDDRYYLVGKLELLDAPGEWFWDGASGTLYFYAPGGVDPSGHQIAVKRRDYGLRAEGRQHLQFDGLTLFACGVRLEACNDCRFENSAVLFSSFTEQERVWRSKAELKQGLDGYLEFRHPAITGDRNVIRNNLFAYGAQTGLYVHGRDDVIENNAFHDFGWLASLGHVALKFSTAYEKPEPGSGCRIRFNTLYNAGGPLLHFNGRNNTVEYNELHHGMRAAFGGNKDVAMLYTQGDLKGSSIRCNWVHDSAGGSTDNAWGNGIGIRGDGGNATRGLTVARNVIWACGSASIMVKNVPDPTPEQANAVWHNTTFDNSTMLLGDNKVDVILAVNSPNENTYSTLYNNAANQLASRWGGKPLPERATISHNCCAERLPLRDPKSLDFRPEPGSALVDAGAVIPGCEEPFAGRAPDIGAYESDAETYWIPGRRDSAASRPLTADGAAGVGLSPELIWLEGYESVSNEVYFGASRPAVEAAARGGSALKGAQRGNIFSPGRLAADTEYFWRVDAVGAGGGVVKGPVWRFRTGL